MNDSVWNLLVELVSAAHSADHKRFIAALQPYGYSTTLEDQQLTALYAHVLLTTHISGTLRRVPTVEDLNQLARAHSRDFDILLPTGPKLTLEETLRKAFKIGQQPEPIKRGIYDISLIAALGLLLEDPQTDLDELRPRLATWCELNATDLEEIRQRAVETRTRSS